MLFMLNDVSSVAGVISYRLRFSLSQFYSLRLRRMKRVAPGTIKVAPIFAKKSKIENVGNSSSSSSRDSNDENERLWKILSWNVAGLRGLAKKNAHKEILSEAADIIFLGEIKCKGWPTELEADFKKYHKTLAISTEKNGGYAGVALLSVVKPLKRGIGDAAPNKEGRLIIAEFSRFFYIGSYVPNSGRGLVNMDKREKWEMMLLEKVIKMAGAPQRFSVYVRNVHYETTEDHLENFFAQAGNVTNVRIVYDPESGKPKGAFCEFSDEAGAENAVNQLNDVEFNGRRIVVHSANK